MRKSPTQYPAGIRPTRRREEMVKGFKRAALALTVAGMLALSACGGSGSTSSPGASGSSGGAGSGSLEVFSWWTSGAEAAALSVLEKAFTTADPNVTFKNAAVSGGGGSNARTVPAPDYKAATHRTPGRFWLVRSWQRPSKTDQ